MKKNVYKSLGKLGVLMALLVTLAGTTKAQQYTLTDADVVMKDGSIESCSYNFAIKDIIIPATLDGQTVTGITGYVIWSKGVFLNKGMTSVVFPEGLTKIGDNAFRDNHLTTLTLPQALTDIGERAFFENRISSLTLPSSLRYLGPACFNKNAISSLNGQPFDGLFYKYNTDGTADNTKLISYGGASKDVVIPSTVEVIDDLVFSSANLGSVDFSAATALKVIGESAFVSNSIVSVDLSACSALTTIKDNAFYSSGVKTLNLNGCTALTTIGVKAFGYNGITSVDLSTCTALKEIGSEAFKRNQIAAINLPVSLTHLGNSAFNSNACTTLNGVAFDGILYKRNADGTEDKTTVVSFSSKANSISIPAGIKVIADEAFANCFSLENVDFSKCVGLETIGEKGFYWCQIKGVDLNACKALSSVGRDAFNNNRITYARVNQCTALMRVGRSAFSGNISSFTLPTPIHSRGAFKHWKDGYGNIVKNNTAPTTTRYVAVLKDCYDVRFEVKNTSKDWNNRNVENEEVTLGTYGTAIADEYDYVRFKYIPIGTAIPYTIVAKGYAPVERTLTVSNADVEKFVYMQSLCDVSFTVKHGSEVLANATVTLAGYGEAITDANGLVTFPQVTPGTENTYTVSAPGYKEASGTIVVDYKSVSANVSMELPLYDVSFKVKSGIHPLSKVEVSLTGYGTATSDANGVVVFTGVAPATDIAYVAFSSGYERVSGVISVSDKDVTTVLDLMVTTHIDDKQSSRLKLYPNPVLNTLHIQQEAESRITRVEVYNLTGRLVKTKLITTDQQTLSFDLGGLPASTYILKCFTADDQVITKQIIKR